MILIGILRMINLATKAARNVDFIYILWVYRKKVKQIFVKDKTVSYELFFVGLVYVCKMPGFFVGSVWLVFSI